MHDLLVVAFAVASKFPELVTDLYEDGDFSGKGAIYCFRMLGHVCSRDLFINVSIPLVSEGKARMLTLFPPM